MAGPDSRAAMPRGLRTGLALLAVLGALALLAPRLATERPWLARRDGRLVSPAWSAGAPSGGGEGRLEELIRAPLPHDPARIRLDRVLQPPSAENWLGTDGLGRDLAARIVHGARVSLGVGLLSALFALGIGIPLGALAGYRRGVADAAVARLVETGLCFPTLLLLLALLAAAPPWLRAWPDALRIAAVLGSTGWIPVARYLRGEFLRLAASDRVASARAAGAAPLRIVTRHLLPAALAPVLVTAAFTVAGSITLEAALSFLGLGVRPPVPAWGGLLTEARAHVDRAWWLALFPGAALFVTLSACALIGEGLRDWLDPGSRR